jgi:hypothetical protein
MKAASTKEKNRLLVELTRKAIECGKTPRNLLDETVNLVELQIPVYNQYPMLRNCNFSTIGQWQRNDAAAMAEEARQFKVIADYINMVDRQHQLEQLTWAVAVEGETRNV